MTREELRLELLKLAHHLSRDASVAVERARELEAYVFEKSVTETLQAPEVKPKGKKSVGNPDILS